MSTTRLKKLRVVFKYCGTIKTYGHILGGKKIPLKAVCDEAVNDLQFVKHVTTLETSENFETTLKTSEDVETTLKTSEDVQTTLKTSEDRLYFRLLYLNITQLKRMLIGSQKKMLMQMR